MNRLQANNEQAEHETVNILVLAYHKRSVSDKRFTNFRTQFIQTKLCYETEFGRGLVDPGQIKQVKHSFYKHGNMINIQLGILL